MPAQGQFGYFPPSQFLPPKHDLRDRTVPAYRDHFHNVFCPDVARRGVVVPVIGHADGELIRTQDGWTRILVALHVQCKTVPGLLYGAPLSDDDAKIASFQANAKRLDMTYQEKGHFFIDAMAAKGWSQAQLCKELCLDKSDVCRTLKPFGRCPPDLLARVGKGIPPRAIYALSGLPTHDLMREFADKLEKGLLCVESLEEQVRALKAGKTTRKARPRTYKHGGILLTVPADLTDEQAAARLADLLKTLRKAS